MKIGERGQVTIPKAIREQFGLEPNAQVEFVVQSGSLMLKKSSKPLNLRKWKGRCSGSFAALGYATVDEFIEDVRGR